MGLSASLGPFVIAAVGAITNLIYSAWCCEHTHLWAACKTDLCKGTISIWWFYFSVLLHAKNKCCKKYEMRSHFPHGSIICCMRWHDIVSLLYISHLILAMPLYQNTNRIFCITACCLTLKHRRIFQDFLICLVSFQRKYSLCYLCRYLCMSNREPGKQTLKDKSKTGWLIQLPFAAILVY